MVQPRWVLAWLRDGGLPDLTVPNMAGPGEPSPAFFAAYGKWMQTPPPSWANIGWVRGQWGGPFMVKGVMRPDDARRAAGIGATAISVSNHGGNDLDGVPASIRALPAVADAVVARSRSCSMAGSGCLPGWSRSALTDAKPNRLPEEDPMAAVQRTAQVQWSGSIARGSGLTSGGSGAISDLPITVASRFGDPGGKTSPEELIAAAHAGCFTMALVACQV